MNTKKIVLTGAIVFLVIVLASVLSQLAVSAAVPLAPVAASTSSEPELDVAKAKAVTAKLNAGGVVSASALKSGSLTTKPKLERIDDIFWAYAAKAKCPKGYQPTGSGLLVAGASGSVYTFWKDGVEGGYWKWEGVVADDKRPNMTAQLRCFKA